jgi:hypothetical protein
VKDKGFGKKTRYAKKESWKPVFTLIALVAVLAQLLFLGFYSTPSVTSPGDSVPNSDERTQVTPEQDADNGASKARPTNDATDNSVGTPDPLNRDVANRGRAERETSDDSLHQDGKRKVSSQDEVLKKLLRATSVEINHEPEIAGTEGTQGSGVIVAVTREGFEVLTACHVVNGKNKLTVVAFYEIGGETERFEYRNVSILNCDKNSDLARLLVVTSDPPKRFVRIMQTPAEPISPVVDNGLAAWGLSWSDNGTPVPKPCRVKSHVTAQRVPGGRPIGYWVLNEPSVPGMSGGPLLNQDGFLIGIASGNSSGAAYYLDEFEISLLMNMNSPTKTKENP